MNRDLFKPETLVDTPTVRELLGVPCATRPARHDSAGLWVWLVTTTRPTSEQLWAAYYAAMDGEEEGE